jgi:hypothetical protein
VATVEKDWRPDPRWRSDIRNVLAWLLRGTSH